MHKDIKGQGLYIRIPYDVPCVTKCVYGATYEGVGDALEERHNTSPDCAIIYFDYFATFN